MTDRLEAIEARSTLLNETSWGFSRLDNQDLWQFRGSESLVDALIELSGDVADLLEQVRSLRACLGWQIKQRLKQATHSERIGLFLCSDEGQQGHSGMAVNERGDVYSWWEHFGPLSVEPSEPGEAESGDPEYQAARAEVGLAALTGEEP